MARWRPLNLSELSEDTQNVYNVLSNESDLACVLIGTSYLAELLASVLREHFIATSIAERILDPQRGAIGGFATRADLAYCLGLIQKYIYQDLTKVSEIRNRFAHKHVALDFNDPDIKARCQDLQAWRILVLDENESPPPELTEEQNRVEVRNQFNLTVILIGSRIHVDAVSRKQFGNTGNTA